MSSTKKVRPLSTPGSAKSSMLQSKLKWPAVSSASTPSSSGPTLTRLHHDGPRYGSQDDVNRTMNRTPLAQTNTMGAGKNMSAKTPRMNTNIRLQNSQPKTQPISRVAVVLPKGKDVRRNTFNLVFDEDALVGDEPFDLPQKRHVISSPSLPLPKSRPGHKPRRDASLVITSPLSMGSKVAGQSLVVELPGLSPPKLPQAVPRSDPGLPQLYSEDVAVTEKQVPMTEGRRRSGRPRVSHSNVSYATTAVIGAEELDLDYGIRKKGASRKRPLVKKNTAVRSGDGRPKGGKVQRDIKYLRQQFMRLRPEYNEYVCEWQDCPAKLFNMETMRRHVEIVHIRPIIRRAIATPRCLWAECGSSAAGVESEVPMGKKFVTVTAMREHIEKAHMMPMNWHLGDGPTHDPDCRGPQILRIGEPLPSYLFDASGTQITPDIRSQQIENPAAQKKRFKRLQKFLDDVYASLPLDTENNDSSDGTGDVASDAH